MDGNARYITYMNIFSSPSVNFEDTQSVKISPDEKQNKVLLGDILFTGSSENLEECGISSVVTECHDNIFLNSFCFGFRLKNKNILIPHFSKHLFRDIKVRNQIIKTANGVTRFNVSKKKMENVKIPVPPLPVQEEIVRILDKFAELTAELTAELAKRKQQYQYYSQDLFSKYNNNFIALGNIAEIGTGSSNTNEEVDDGDYPFFVRSQEIRKKDTWEYDETAIITAGDGVGVGKIFHYIEGKYALHQRAYRIHIISKNVLPKYFFYYMKNTFLSYITQNAVHASVTSIRKRMLDNYLVPVPPLEEQERIVAILDRFDALCNDLTSGLPAEIEARKKQYEYYRDKLLTFKEAV